MPADGSAAQAGGNPCKIAPRSRQLPSPLRQHGPQPNPTVSGGDGSLVAIHDKFSRPVVDIRAASGNYKLTERFTAGQSALLLCTPVGNVSLAICKDCFDTYRGIWLDQLLPGVAADAEPGAVVKGTIWR